MNCKEKGQISDLQWQTKQFTLDKDLQLMIKAEIV